MNDAAPQIKLTNSRRKYDDIMLSIIVIFFAINLANCEEVWQELCSGENGSLYFENSGNNHIATTYIDKNRNVLTEFLSDDTTYKFRCDSGNGAPNITLDSKHSLFPTHYSSNNLTVYGTLYHNETKNNQFGTNKEDILKCRNTLSKKLICKVTLIIIENKKSNLDCQVDGSLSCDVAQQVQSRHNNLNFSVDADDSGEDSEEDDSDKPIFKPKNGFIPEDDLPVPPTEPTFESYTTYKVYDPLSDTSWLNCTEYQDDGEECEAGTCLDIHTTSIKCPINLNITVERQVIIQIAEVTKTKECVNAPFLYPCPQPKYSFMTVQIDEDNFISIEQGDMNLAYSVGVGIPVGLVAAILCISAIMCNKKKQKRNSSEFDDEDIGNFNDPSEEAVKARKKIISRQLSGDPSKLNPDLPLNQQAKVLSYNPDFEIDFSNFKIGKLLGSGNFGCVFEGTANGIFHPGSVTKVAIKTVNDNLDRTQVGALLCEIKILASLELNLNLVNLLGSCTSNLHNGDLYMLMEFCPHGNLKDFLIKHRQDFYSSVINNIAVNDLDDRLFLKWAHSIAKGMEYLFKKKIMHGDLAARNILIGGLEGSDSDNFVAKISDFGLSKNFYDNYRYKKQIRDVPWKWMAYEYLKDGIFSMKSDVWSYGVVIWEILSLGQEPYPGRTYDGIIKEFNDGFRLSCPQELRQLPWLEEFYSKITEGCWQTETSKRFDFTKIVEIMEKDYLTSFELNQHQNLNEQYKTMKALLTDDDSKLKRISTLPSIQDIAYSKVGALDANEDTLKDNNVMPQGYVQVGDLQSSRNDPQELTISSSGGYITKTQAEAMA